MRTHYDWAADLRALRGSPNTWLLRHADASATAVKLVRLRRHPSLRIADGTIEPLLRQVYVDELGHKRGDLYLRFVPN